MEDKQEKIVDEKMIRAVYTKLAQKLGTIRDVMFALAITLALGGYFAYEKLKSEGLHTKQLELKVDGVLRQNSYYYDNIRAFSGTACASCHLEMSMMLPKSTLTLGEFKSYVRGTDRFGKNNSVMPGFDNSTITEKELDNMWKILY